MLFVTHSIPEGGVPVDQDRGDVAAARAASSISSIADFPRDRTLEIRETPEFLKIAQRVRVGLRAGHSYDE